MANIGFILLVFSFVFAVIAAFFGPLVSPPFRVHFGWLSIAFFVASKIFGGH